MPLVDIIEQLDHYDFALLDTSFFQIGGGPRLFYHLGSAIELDLIRDQIRDNADNLSWVNRKAMALPQVYLTPGIVEELKRFHEHLKNIYTFCSSRNKFGPNRKLRIEMTAKKESWKNQLDESEPKYFPKINPKPLSGLAQLDRTVRLVGRTIKKAQVYSPDGFTFENPSPEISPVDYELISAAISYLQFNPEHKVGVFTKDFHHLEIHREYLEWCPPRPGTIAVLRFHANTSITDGKLSLRHRRVGYYPLDEKQPEVRQPVERFASEKPAEAARLIASTGGAILKYYHS